MSTPGPEAVVRRRQAHLLRAQGLTIKQVQAALAPVGLTTVGQWLRGPCPTEQEAADAQYLVDNPRTGQGGQVELKVRFPPELFKALRAEAFQQGAPMSRVVDCATRLYLDCAERIRTGGTDPVNLTGYRP